MTVGDHIRASGASPRLRSLLCGFALVATVPMVAGASNTQVAFNAMSPSTALALRPLEAAEVADAGTAGDVHALGVGAWLVARDNGLWVVDDRSRKRVATGRYESLDTRAGVVVDGRALVLVSAIDVDAGAVRLLLLDTQASEVTADVNLVYADALPEVQCLYREPRSGNIAVFTVDARGTLEQRYVYHGAAQVLVNLPARRDVGLLEAEACEVRDATGELFIAEGPIGVWRYRASEESDALREAVLLREPWGSLPDDIEDIAVDDDGALWALVPGHNQVQVRAEDGSLAVLDLPAQGEPVALAVDRSAGERALALFDEGLGLALVAETADLPPMPSVEAPDATVAATVFASGQTAPVHRYGDAADDPAILVPHGNNTEPLILGTDKREGLAVYSLQGELLQMLSVGRLNNVDLLAGIEIGGRERTVAAASNRSGNSIALFEVDGGRVRHLADVPTDLGEVYGLCMYASASGAYVFINATDGRYQQYRLSWVESGPGADLVREFRLPSQPEGCVADPLSGRLYMGEEAAGIWEAGAEPDGAAPRLVIQTSDALVADVEGMDIYREGLPGAVGERVMLVVSSQGSDSYAIYDLANDYRLLASFAIVADLGVAIDGVSETDGLAVTAKPLPGFPRGILVVQDGRNRLPDAPQNFKIVDWREIDRLLPPGGPRPQG